MRYVTALILALLGAAAWAGQAPSLHVVSTSEVRGTLGICG